MDVLEVEDEVSLTAEEYVAIVRYLAVKHFYFRGHMDSFAYLKKKGAI